MKKVTQLFGLFFFISLYFGGGSSLAQMHHGFHPDSLVLTTLTGTAIVIDSDTLHHSIYFLDEDGDGEADYHLNFGPFWYQPDSSDAVRPINGEEITVTGGLRDNRHFDIETLVVFRINGKFWRNPFAAMWHHTGHGFGWDRDSMETVSLSGTALVDTTFFFNRYYIDVNSDFEPDYLLNFGPPWYQPESGATRPENGEQIDIIGGTFSTDMQMQMVIVYEINGLTWRDSSRFGRHFGGGWMHGNMSGSASFFSPFDDEDVFTVYQGWADNGMGGGMMFPDSLFCSFNEVLPEEMPDVKAFAGYRLELLKPDGNSMMGGGGMNGSMSFANEADFKLHYSDEQLNMYDVDESSIKVRVWNEQSNSWDIVASSVDVDNNIVAFSSSSISPYIALTGDNLTSINNENKSLPKTFSLAQNFPNPFNPSTRINFTVNKDANVSLIVYNVLGEKVKTLLNEFRTAGSYTITFDASDLRSGIYFYSLSAGSTSIVRKMTLLK